MSRTPSSRRSTGLVLAVALVVLTGLSGCSSHSSGSSEHGHNNTPVAGDAREIVVNADTYLFSPQVIEATEGENLAIRLNSKDMEHDLKIEGVAGHVAADKGGSAVGGFTVKQAGEFAIVCTELGHKEKGMIGILRVKDKNGNVPTSVPKTTPKTAFGVQAPPTTAMPGH